MKHDAQVYSRSCKRQRGVVLFIALIVLIVMTMASIALIRSTDTVNVIAGNIAFRQAALQESDTGIDAAFRAMGDPLGAGYVANKAVSSAPRYYAVMQTLGANGAPTLIYDMLPSDAVGNADVYGTTNGFGPNGNRVRYVVERMCNPVAGGTAAPASEAEIKANCITYQPGSMSNSSRNAGRIKLNAVTLPNVYYRVTVRVDGPRGTVSIAQSIVRV